MISKAKRNRVYCRDRWRCHWCEILLQPDAATIDHLVPRSRGGSDHETNLVASCAPCNVERADSFPPLDMLRPEMFRPGAPGGVRWSFSTKRFVAP